VSLQSSERGELSAKERVIFTLFLFIPPVIDQRCFFMLLTGDRHVKATLIDDEASEKGLIVLIVLPSVLSESREKRVKQNKQQKTLIETRGL
jgi:hypothetical protein